MYNMLGTFAFTGRQAAAMRELARMHQQTFVTRARHETRSPGGRSVNAVQGLRERAARSNPGKRQKEE